ncbi:nocturnin, partial [Paragonimus westermani]
RSDRLQLVQSRELPLDEFVERSALFCEFRLIVEPVCSSSTFYVTSAHLKAKPSCFNIRLEQGRYLLKSLGQLAHEKHFCYPPLFICGDFNAEPHESVVKMLLDAFNQNSPEWNLHSAYAEANLGEEPEFTTWKIRESKRLSKRTEVCHTIDYVLYSPQSVQLLGVWWIPNRHHIGPHGLPSSCFPSDHLNLIADFKLRQTGVDDG